MKPLHFYIMCLSFVNSRLRERNPFEIMRKEKNWIKEQRMYREATGRMDHRRSLLCQRTDQRGSQHEGATNNVPSAMKISGLFLNESVVSPEKAVLVERTR